MKKIETLKGQIENIEYGDKGNMVVAFSKDDFISKINDFISSGHFTIIKKDAICIMPKRCQNSNKKLGSSYWRQI